MKQNKHVLLLEHAGDMHNMLISKNLYKKDTLVFTKGAKLIFNTSALLMTPKGNSQTLIMELSRVLNSLVEYKVTLERHGVLKKRCRLDTKVPNKVTYISFSGVEFIFYLKDLLFILETFFLDKNSPNEEIILSNLTGINLALNLFMQEAGISRLAVTEKAIHHLLNPEQTSGANL